MTDLNRFCAHVADVLEVGTIGPDERFRDTPGWCSLKAFALLVLLENDYGAALDIVRFQELGTVRDLYNEVERHTKETR